MYESGAGPKWTKQKMIKLLHNGATENKSNKVVTVGLSRRQSELLRSQQLDDKMKQNQTPVHHRSRAAVSVCLVGSSPLHTGECCLSKPSRGAAMRVSNVFQPSGHVDHRG